MAGSEHGEKVVSNLKRWSMFGPRRALGAASGVSVAHTLENPTLLLWDAGQISKSRDNAISLF